jgi:hypothetical protein
VVLTANHYLLDVVVGVSLTTVCWIVVALPWRRWIVRVKAAGTRGRTSTPLRHHAVTRNMLGS